MSSKIKIGTRKSELALVQTNSVARTLAKKGIKNKVHHVVTLGDKDQRPFEQITQQGQNGDGFFTKEIERQLLRKKIDLAVHSSKDLPSQTHHDLPWMAFGEREAVQDVLIIPEKNLVSVKPLKIKESLQIGTSSPRREFQLKKLFPNAKIEPIRGNVPTRIKKIIDGEFDATVLALAGIRRLKLEKQIQKANLKIVKLPFITAPCQGILGIQAHKNHLKTLHKIANKELTEIAHTEKTILALLGGGCQLAVGSQFKKIKNKYALDFYFHDTKNECEFSIKEKTPGEVLRKLFSRILKIENGPRVVLTQTLQHQLRSAQKLTQAGFQVIPWSPLEVLPTWQMKHFINVKKELDEFDAVIFTSAFSVRILMNEFVSLDPEIYKKLKVKNLYAIGASTKKELAQYGFSEIHCPKESHGQALFNELKAQYPLFVGTKDAVFLSLLKKNGRNYKFLELYKSFSSEGPLSDLPKLKDGDKVVLTSPRQVESLRDFYRKKTSRPSIQVYAFGPSTSRALIAAKIKHEVNPQSGNWDSLIKLLK